jgi:hypothetical protein
VTTAHLDPNEKDALLAGYRACGRGEVSIADHVDRHIRQSMLGRMSATSQMQFAPTLPELRYAIELGCGQSDGRHGLIGYRAEYGPDLIGIAAANHQGAITMGVGLDDALVRLITDNPPSKPADVWAEANPALDRILKKPRGPRGAPMIEGDDGTVLMTCVLARLLPDLQDFQTAARDFRRMTHSHGVLLLVALMHSEKRRITGAVTHVPLPCLGDVVDTHHRPD